MNSYVFIVRVYLWIFAFSYAYMNPYICMQVCLYIISCAHKCFYIYICIYFYICKYIYSKYSCIHLHALHVYNDIFTYPCIHQHNLRCILIYAYLRFSTPKESGSTEKLARANKGISLSLTQRFKKGLTKFSAELPKAVSVSIVAIASGVRVCMYLYINL